MSLLYRQPCSSGRRASAGVHDTPGPPASHLGLTLPGRVVQVRPLFLMPGGVLCDAPQGSSRGTWPAASTPLLPGRWGWRISTPASPQPSSRLPDPQLQSPHVEGKLLLPQSGGLHASSPDPLFPTAHLGSEGKTVCSSSRASALAQPHPIFPVPPAPMNQLLLPWLPLNLLFSTRRVHCGGHPSAPPWPAASRAPALTQHFLHPPRPPHPTVGSGSLRHSSPCPLATHC